MRNIIILTCMPLLLLLAGDLFADNEAPLGDQRAYFFRSWQSFDSKEILGAHLRHADTDELRKLKGQLRLKRKLVDLDPKAKNDGMCTTAAILGFVGLLLFFLLLPSFLGVIFGIIGIIRVKKHPERRGKGAAITGLILGIIGLVLGILAWSAPFFG
ncbi:MAG: DUF4190 domain-containing protein [Saprospiraceae bacterium]|nr:DUF4190 domain-containing protein [Saprospiraceae bacterium]